MNYIYALKDPITDEVVYIGKTKNFKKRLRDHHRIEKRIRCRLDRWKIKMHHLGLKAKMEILLVCDENENVNEQEKLFIKSFKEKGINLLNMTEGGDGLQNPSEEVRRKIGEKSKGRIPSKETREKISKSNYNSGNSKPIICYDIKGNFIGNFINARRVGEFLNLDYRAVSEAALDDSYFVGNKYTFFFVDDVDVQDKLKYRIENTIKNGQEFLRIDSIGNIKEYDNLLKAARDNNLNFRNIWLCLNNKRKRCGEFAWCYKDAYDLNFEKYFIRKNKSKKVLFTLDSNKIIFESLKEASERTGIHKTTLCNYLNGKNIPKSGEWKYIL
jgi:hypothetical protein